MGAAAVGSTVIWMPLAAVQYCTSGGPNSAVCHQDWGAGGISSGSGMPYGACSPIAHSAARVVRSDAWNVEAARCSRRSASVRRCWSSATATRPPRPRRKGGGEAPAPAASTRASSVASAWERRARAMRTRPVQTSDSRLRSDARSREGVGGRALPRGPRCAAPPRPAPTMSATRAVVSSAAARGELGRVGGPQPRQALRDLRRQQQRRGHVSAPPSAPSAASPRRRIRGPRLRSPGRGSAGPAGCPAPSVTSGPSRTPGR